MALTPGTNCGFVTVAPTADPAASNTIIDAYAYAVKYTSPATAIKVTEIGWYCDNATEEANFEVGIYAHDAGDDEPGAVIGSLSQTNAKGTGAGWKKVTVDITIEPNTIYWIAFQLDGTTTTTYLNYAAGSSRFARKDDPQITLSSPWGNSSVNYDNYDVAIYAVWTAGINMKINIGDAWKDVNSMKINIGGSWKDVTEIKQNIGDTWKTVF